MAQRHLREWAREDALRVFWGLGLVFLSLACSDPPQHECDVAEDCAAGLGCLNQRCVALTPCVDDGVCGAQQICLGGVCDVRQCVADAVCGRQRVCLDGWCGARPAGYCTTDEECAPSVCDLSANRCLVAIVPCPDGGCVEDGAIEECEGDDACPTNQYCDDGRCLDGCRLAPGLCGEGLACDPESRQCSLRPCSADPDCPLDRFCTDEGVCRIGCRLTADACDEGVCDADHRRCVGARCRAVGDCPADQICALDRVDGPLRCRLVTDLAPPGAPCQQAAECASAWCVDDRCLTACASDAQCGAERCAPVEIPIDGGDVLSVLACRPPLPACVTDGDCPPDTRCVPGPESQPLMLDLQCVPAAGLGAYMPTMGAEECDSGLMAAGRCWGPCRVDADCPDGERCYADELYLTDDRGSANPHDDLFAAVPACAPDRGSGASCGERPCADEEVCVPRPNPDRTGFRGVCQRPIGLGLAGTPCERETDCRSGWCQQYCVEMCRPTPLGAPCPEGAQCAEISLPVWDRGTPEGIDDPMAEVFTCVIP